MSVICNIFIVIFGINGLKKIVIKVIIKYLALNFGDFHVVVLQPVA